MQDPRWLHEALEAREAKGRRRALRQDRTLVDFCSNDYLGFARDPGLWHRWLAQVQAHPADGLGATGSRLLRGNAELAEATEATVASYHGAPAALLYPSGYTANLGLITALSSRNDTLLYDKLVHASLREGIRLSLAQAQGFAHNDLAALQQRLKQVSGRCFVIVEALYSMDGDAAPLAALAELTQRFGAYLIVDEAHSNGILGPGGRGLVEEAGVAEQCLARVHTFGKAPGCQGAAVLGSSTLREYLINFSKAFIYTTAPMPAQLWAIRTAYEALAEAEPQRRQLLANRDRLQQFMAQNFAADDWCGGAGPIFGLILGNEQRTRQASDKLQATGLDVRPILAPTVPRGSERLRICLHSFNTEAEIQALADALHKTGV